jgi:hypothetical protein
MTPEQKRDLERSIRRTLVPIVAGFLLSQAARVGLSIPESDLVGVLEAIVTGAYYSVVRILEMRYPQVGVLLGALSTPRYS